MKKLLELKEYMGMFLKGDFENAVEGFRIHAEKGDAKAQFYLSDLYGGGGYYPIVDFPKDIKKSIYWEKKSASLGNKDAQYNLGVHYDEGLVIKQDFKKAVKWYTLSANQGNALAQFNLGSLYNLGKGINKDSIKSYMWFYLAFKNGYPDGENAMNEIKINENLSDSDLMKAKKMAKKYLHLKSDSIEISPIKIDR